MKFILLLIPVLYLAVGCTNNSANLKLPNSDGAAEIDVADAIENPSEDISDFVEWAKPIPLETNPNSIVSNFVEVRFGNGYIYVLDVYKNNIVIFDADGKYVRKLRKGNGLGEITSPSDICCSCNDSCLYVNDMFRLIKYSPDGEYVTTFYYNPSIEFRKFAVENGKVVGAKITLSDSIFVVSSDTSFKNVELTFMGKAYFRQSSVMRIQPTNEGMIISKPFKNDIYCCKDGKVSLKYQIKNGLPELEVPDKHGPKTKEQLQEESKIQTENTFVGYYYMSERFQVFDFMKNSGCGIEVFRDCENGSLWALENSSLFIQGVYDYSENIFASLLNSESFSFSNLSNLISDADMEKLKSVKPDDNPIIVLFKLKSEI